MITTYDQHTPTAASDPQAAAWRRVMAALHAGDPTPCPCGTEGAPECLVKREPARRVMAAIARAGEVRE